MTAVEWVDRWWMAPGPARLLGLFRVLVGGFGTVYLVVRWPNLVSSTGFEARQFEPVGVVSILEQPVGDWLLYALVVGAIGAGVAFTLGWRFGVSGPVFAVLLLVVLTYRNSWGQVFHTENLLVLHALVLGLSRSADGLSLDARGGTADVRGEAYGWPLRLCGVVTVLAYVIAGMAKLDEAGLGWVTSDALRNQVAYDNLRKELLGDYHAPLGAWLVGHGWVFKPLAMGTLVVELGAPLALLGRRLAIGWAVSAWLFHVGIVATMAILFPYQLLGVAFVPLILGARGAGASRETNAGSGDEGHPSPVGKDAVKRAGPSSASGGNGVRVPGDRKGGWR